MRSNHSGTWRFAYDEAGRAADAERLFRQVVETAGRSKPRNDRFYGDSLSMLGGCLVHSRQYAAACRSCASRSRFSQRPSKRDCPPPSRKDCSARPSPVSTTSPRPSYRSIRLRQQVAGHAGFKSSRPDYFANSNSATSCKCDWRQDLKFQGRPDDGSWSLKSLSQAG